MAYSAQRVPRPCRAVYTFFRFVGIADIATVERADSQEMGILFVAQIPPPKSGDAADFLVTFNFQLTNFSTTRIALPISQSHLWYPRHPMDRRTALLGPGVAPGRRGAEFGWWWSVAARQRGPNRVAPGHTGAVPHSLIRWPAPGETVGWCVGIGGKGGKRSVSFGVRVGSPAKFVRLIQLTIQTLAKSTCFSHPIKWYSSNNCIMEELVFIGQNLDKEKLRKQVEEALVTEEEFQLGPEEWNKWPNCFKPKKPVMNKARRKRLANVRSKMGKQRKTQEDKTGESTRWVVSICVQLTLNDSEVVAPQTREGFLNGWSRAVTLVLFVGHWCVRCVCVCVWIS